MEPPDRARTPRHVRASAWVVLAATAATAVVGVVAAAWAVATQGMRLVVVPIAIGLVLPAATGAVLLHGHRGVALGLATLGGLGALWRFGSLFEGGGGWDPMTAFMACLGATELLALALATGCALPGLVHPARRTA